MTGDAEFQKDLLDLGFRLSQERASTSTYVQQVTPFLTYSVHWSRLDHSVLFSWELAIGEFMSAHGLQIGTDEHLNQFLFPKFDARGEQDTAFVVDEMNRVEQVLRSIDFLGS